MKQEAGNAVYWVPPGKRRLSETVFGTPDNPQARLEPKLKQAGQLPSPLGENVQQLLKDLPILVGLPPKARETNADGTKFTMTKIPTPFPDTGKITSGELDLTYKDRRPYDLPGNPTETPDDVDLTTTFTDPAGNEYQLKVGTVFQPPLPGYETGGGVMTNAWHHGGNGTGSPLMPRVFTYGAFWGIGNVVVNGEVADKRKVMHFMTTQNVRKSDYSLALDEELPLKKENTIGGQVHHTHGIVLPITMTDKGPSFQPVKTAFTLPNGKPQPFIHIMFEKDTLTRSAFKNWKPNSTSGTANQGRDVTVRQEPGKPIYWVPPGKRRLSEQVFGTPDNPKALLEPKIKQAKQLPSPLNEAVPQLLKDLPILVGLPLKARETNADGTKFTTTKIPTPFPDAGKVTSGELELTYKDRRPYDLPGNPSDTKDTAELQTLFTDPAGNEYELALDHVIQPPIPGYETGGGVMTNAWHHGITGTGSPLMPQVYNYGAFWGVGNVIINGEVADERKVMHFMTTQNVRKSDYSLALDEELPLKKEDTIGGQVHHTHGIVLPITATENGPAFQPVKTAFTLPNGNQQPFIHIMFEKDTIVKHPFKNRP